ncbi:MAG: phage capsid protein [Alphaproteobacteria bacterium]
MSGNPYVNDPQQLATVIGYKNAEMIADKVMPRVQVGKKDFKYSTSDLADGFSLPDTRVGRKSEPTQASFGTGEATGNCHDYGLTDVIPNDDVDENAKSGLPNPVNRSSMFLTNLIHLDREVRVAGKVFNSANYDHTVSLLTAARFNKDVDALSVLLEYLDTPIVRPNTMTIGQAAWTGVRTNNAIVKAIHGNSGESGAVSRRALAELLEIKDIHVGGAWVNTARKGKAPVISRTWGKHIAFTYQDAVIDKDSATTWGFTGQYGGWVAGRRDLPGVGLRGGTGIKVGETVGEVIAAKGAGFFIENVVD